MSILVLINHLQPFHKSMHIVSHHKIIIKWKCFYTLIMKSLQRPRIIMAEHPFKYASQKEVKYLTQLKNYTNSQGLLRCSSLINLLSHTTNTTISLFLYTNLWGGYGLNISHIRKKGLKPNLNWGLMTESLLLRQSLMPNIPETEFSHQNIFSLKHKIL